VGAGGDECDGSRRAARADRNRGDPRWRRSTRSAGGLLMYGTYVRQASRAAGRNGRRLANPVQPAVSPLNR